MIEYYSIDDGHGQQLATGLELSVAWKVARRRARERGESVYIYGYGEDVPEEIEPYRYRVHNSAGGLEEECDSLAAALNVLNELSFPGEIYRASEDGSTELVPTEEEDGEFVTVEVGS